METNNLFRNFGPNNTQNPNWNGYGYGAANVGQPSTYTNNYINRNTTPMSNIPVRVVFSPEQIAPQEIPTNGTPALFPISDGSCIIAKSLLPNGMFDERVYMLQQPTNRMDENKTQPSEFDQVMLRLNSIETNLKRVLNDLYGSKTQEGAPNE